jgi:hypothetical protein
LTAESRAGFLYVANDRGVAVNIYGYNVNEATGALTLLAGFPIAISSAPGAGGFVGYSQQLTTILPFFSFQIFKSSTFHLNLIEALINLIKSVKLIARTRPP